MREIIADFSSQICSGPCLWFVLCVYSSVPESYYAVLIVQQHLISHQPAGVFQMKALTADPQHQRVTKTPFISSRNHALMQTVHKVISSNHRPSLCDPDRTLTSCSSTIWMFQPLRIVGNHVVRSCAPSIQTRRSGPNGRRRSWSAS